MFGVHLDVLAMHTPVHVRIFPSPQQPGVMMSRGPMLVGAGGDARPVQIPAGTQTSGDSGFGFLGKSSKSQLSTLSKTKCVR